MNRLVSPLLWLFSFALIGFLSSTKIARAETSAAVTTQAYTIEQGDSDIADPLEPMNRGIFWVNDQLYTYLLRPISKGYDYVTPNAVQDGVGNFFENLGSPIYMASDLLQAKFEQFANHSGRFLINTTVGLVGIFDVAAELGLEEHKEDIGSAFGYWGIGEGFYLVLPLLGPSNLRDGIGRIGDSLLYPTTYFSYFDSGLSNSEETAIVIGTRALEAVHDTNKRRDGIDTAREGSVDFYAFTRAAYHQHRLNIIYDDRPPQSESPPSYEDELDAIEADQSAEFNKTH